MPFICVICRDELVRRTGSGIGILQNSSFDWTDCEENPEDTSLVATTCGHLFHRSCLTNWFRVEFESGAPWKSCPYCKKVFVNPDSMQQQGFHRIFPVCAEIYEDQEHDTFKNQGQLEKLTEEGDESETEIKNLKAVNLIQKKTNELLEAEVSKIRERTKMKSVAIDELQTKVTGLSDILQSLEIENKALRTLRNKLLKNMETKMQGKGDQFNHHQKLQQTAHRAAPIVTTTGLLNTSNSKNDTTEPTEISPCETQPSFPPPILPPKHLSNRTRTSSYKSGDLRLGDRVLYRSSSIFAGPLPYSGIVKSLYLNRFGRKIAGVEFDQKIPHGMSGLFFIRQYFDCRPKHGRLIENSRLTKIEPFQLRPVIPSESDD